MENQYRFLEFEGVQIAAFIEAHSENGHSEYYPKNILFHVEQGQLHIRSDRGEIRVEPGHFCLVRKFTQAYYYKTWSDPDQYAVVTALILQDRFIDDVIKDLRLPKPRSTTSDAVILLEENSILKELHSTLHAYWADNESPDAHFMFSQTRHAILGILQQNPSYLSIFYDFSRPVKAELIPFMEHHFTSGLSLNELAKLSGRSLSTFNRDFRKEFGQNPHQWRLSKRLNRARFLLENGRRPSEIYLDLGFKDLAHFSRTFKKAFKMPPSQIAGT